jgi:hypothetical protein
VGIGFIETRLLFMGQSAVTRKYLYRFKGQGNKNIFKGFTDFSFLYVKSNYSLPVDLAE